jgi:hypothetical protein
MTATGSAQCDDNTRRFALVRERFARARNGCLSGELDFRFAAQAVQLRVAGRALLEAMQAPFAHLRTDERGTAPPLAIDLWDVAESAVEAPPADLAQPTGSRWDLGDSLLALSEDARFVCHAVRRSVVWLDRHDCRIAGWFADGRDLSLHQRGKPLQMLLAVWARDRGLHAVHAALVGRGQRGVLLPGRSGSGKTTAALAALQDGYTYIGDDWIALGRAADGAHVGHGLYGSACLESRHAGRFVHLHPQVVESTSAPERKSLLLLSRTMPERLADSIPLCAVALPRVVDRNDARVLPASRREALLTIVPSTIFTMSPRGGRRDTERLFELAEQLPAYRLEIGRDLQQIPRCIDEILQDVAAS